jgi:hypothetical protein
MLDPFKVDFWSREVLGYAFAVLRRTIAESTWGEIRTAQVSGIALRELATLCGMRSLSETHFYEVARRNERFFR